VEAIVPSDRHPWIGAKDDKNEGSWYWVDGTPMTYKNFNRPLDGSHEDCAYIRPYGDYVWNDLDCSYKSPFPCKIADYKPSTGFYNEPCSSPKPYICRGDPEEKAVQEDKEQSGALRLLAGLAAILALSLITLL